MTSVMASTPAGTAAPNCFSCPNRLTPEQAATDLGRSVNGDVCLVKGIVIGSARMEANQRLKLGGRIAKDCGSYGVKKAKTPTNTFRIALPDPTALKPDPLAGTVPSCKGCVHFVSESKVASAWGWNAGFCAAKGELLLANKLSHIARNCDVSVFGKNSLASLDEIDLHGEYADAFNPVIDPVKHFLRTGKLIDPLDYDSDDEVTAEEKEEGILAWRHIRDKNDTDRYVRLPIFNPDRWDEHQSVKVPRTGDDEHPELYIDHDNLSYTVGALWMGMGETPALWGQPGLGKTELLRHMAWLMQIPFTRLSITGASEIDDIAGKMMYDPERGTYFQSGRLPKSYVNPGVVCIDEPNTGPAEVWQFIRPLTDNSKQLALDMADGQIIRKHRWCFLGMAMNPAWDVRNVGALQIGAADGSRLMHISIELPPPDIEKQIIRSRVKLDGWAIDDHSLNLIMRIAADIRTLCAEEVLPITWGIREQIKVARAWRWFPPRVVYQVSAGDYMEPEARARLMDVLNTHLT